MLKNLILISADTLRFDALGCEPDTRFLERPGFSPSGRRETPAMDRLSGQGIHFNNCLTTAPYTTNSHASLLTGCWPWRHGIRPMLVSRRIGDGIPVLAERLKGAGFATLTATGMPHIFNSERPDFRRGVDDFINMETHLLGQNIPSVYDWIRTHQTDRFFVFYHSTTIHDYITPTTLQRSGATAKLNPSDFYSEIRTIFSAPPPTQMALYLQAVNHFDRTEIRPLLDFLETRKLMDSTLLVLLSDHGEPIRPGAAQHRDRLTGESLRVPVLLHAPGNIPGNRRIQDLVRLIDVHPTVLHLLGLPPDRQTIDGQDLSPYWASEAPPSPRMAYAEVAMHSTAEAEEQVLSRCVQREDRKIVRSSKDATALYDLSEDFLETTPRAATGDPLLAELEAIIRSDRPLPSPEENATGPSRDVVERLRQLGYLE